MIKEGNGKRDWKINGKVHVEQEEHSRNGGKMRRIPFGITAGEDGETDEEVCS